MKDKIRSKIDSEKKRMKYFRMTLQYSNKYIWYLLLLAVCPSVLTAFCVFSVRHDRLFLQFQGVLRRGFQDDLPCRVRDKSEVILSWHSGAYRYPRVFQHTFRRG